MFLLKYKTGALVGEDNGSGGYPYPTLNLSSAVIFNTQLEAAEYLSRLRSLFLNTWDDKIYQVTVS